MSDTDQLVGKTIGSYRIVKCLGKGGMGAVYFGEHPKIESKVAIKVLLPRFVSAPDIVRRFFDEARAVNRIGHPGIVRIHDCNKQEDVGVYLVMELLEGESLAERFTRVGQLGWEEVARLVQQSASALQASHNTGIIHRDLKPANIFVVPDPDMPGGERIKILDFGIAKLLEDNDPMDGLGTKTGMVIGSPMYMSPEQCIDSKSVDRRTDIYSLGAIAYRLIAGEFPYEADTLGRLILKQQKEKPAPLQSLKVEVPTAVTEVIHRALETDREQRYSDMAEFREAMRAAVEAADEGRERAPEPARGSAEDGDDVTPVSKNTAPKQREGVEPATGSQDIALDETAVADVEETGPARTGDGAREEQNSTTLSGTVGEKTEPQRSEPQRGKGALIAGAIVLLMVAIIALVLWSRHGQHIPPPLDDPGRRTASVQPMGDERPLVAMADDDKALRTRPARVESKVPLPPPPAVSAPPQVLITLKLTPAGARVSLDGALVTANPLVLPLDGKQHKLQVEAPGYRAAERTVMADTSQTLEIDLEKVTAKKAGARPAGASGKLKKKKLFKKKQKKKKKKRIYFRNL